MKSIMSAARENKKAIKATAEAKRYPRRWEQTASKNAMPAIPAPIWWRIRPSVKPCKLAALAPEKASMPREDISLAE
jgi:hypothetical protein